MMGYSVSKLLKVAKGEVGYLEKETNSSLDHKTLNAGDENYTKYARDLYSSGYYNGNKNGYAWCDVFVDWCFLQLCDGDAVKAEWIICQTGDYGAGCGYSMRYYQSAGRFYKTPKPGDQIFFGTASNVSHTGIVAAVDSSRVYTIEGNTSSTSGVVANGGGVFEKSYPINYARIVGYGRPRYDADETDLNSENVIGTTIATLSRGSSGASVKELQQKLISLGYSCGSAGADGVYGNGTFEAVKKFQASMGLAVDGIFGSKTSKALDAACSYTLEAFVRDVQSIIGATVDGDAGQETLSKTITVSLTKNNRHKIVRPIQKRLMALGYKQVGQADGIAGGAFDAAVKALQKDCGFVQDGEVTARNKTWKKLLGML